MCHSNTHMDGGSHGVPVDQSITLPLLVCILPIVNPGATCSPGKRCTWCKRKCGSSFTFFQCSVVQFWSSHTHCWCFKWIAISMGTLTGLWLSRSKQNKLQCTLYSDSIGTSMQPTRAAVWRCSHLAILPIFPASKCILSCVSWPPVWS